MKKHCLENPIGAIERCVQIERPIAVQKSLTKT